MTIAEQNVNAEANRDGDIQSAVVIEIADGEIDRPTTDAECTGQNETSRAVIAE